MKRTRTTIKLRRAAVTIGDKHFASSNRQQIDHLESPDSITSSLNTNEGLIDGRDLFTKAVVQQSVFEPRPLTRIDVQQLVSKPENPFLKRMIAQFGISQVVSDPEIVSDQLTTEYSIKPDCKTNQGQSGRCWIFGTLNMMRQYVSEEYGEKFQYSQSFVAFYDKLERAYAFLQKMIKYSSDPAEGQKV